MFFSRVFFYGSLFKEPIDDRRLSYFEGGGTVRSIREGFRVREVFSMC